MISVSTRGTMSTFIFGDVHGDSKALAKIIQKAKDEGGSDIALYSVGDLIDRGPDSFGVLDTCVEQGVQGIVGNHEVWFFNYIASGVLESYVTHKVMGGAKTLLSYGVQEEGLLVAQEKLATKIPHAHKDWVLGLPLVRTLEVGGVTYRLTHGGIPAGIGAPLYERFKEELLKYGVPVSDAEISKHVFRLISEKNSDAFLWVGATRKNCYTFPDGSYQVFGHTPWAGGAEINSEFRYIALDTGCGTRPPYNLSGVLLLESGERKIITSRG